MTYTVTYQFPNGPVLTDRGLTREGVEALMNTIFRHGGTGRCVSEAEARQARRDELVARGLARAARGRIYDMIQRGHA